MDSHLMNGLFHVLFVAPLLIYVGIQGTAAPKWIYGLLAFLVIGIVGYHAWRAFDKIRQGKSAWINWIHLLLVAPLLAWIAAQQKEAPRRAYEMTLMLGFAALGYHGYYLVAPHTH